MPRKKTAKTPHILLATEVAMIGALNRHAEITLRLKSEDAAHEEQIAGLNTLHAESTQTLRDELATLEGSIQLYCVNNRAQLFPNEKKSKDYDNATIGFRLNPHSVGTVISKESMETIALRLDKLEWGKAYVTWKPSVNKDYLLRDRLTLTAGQLQEAGIKFVQGEQFFIEPAADAADRISKPTEAATA